MAHLASHPKNDKYYAHPSDYCCYICVCYPNHPNTHNNPIKLKIEHAYNCPKSPMCDDCQTRLDVPEPAHSSVCPYRPKCPYCNIFLDQVVGHDKGDHITDCAQMPRCGTCKSSFKWNGKIDHYFTCPEKYKLDGSR